MCVHIDTHIVLDKKDVAVLKSSTFHIAYIKPEPMHMYSEVSSTEFSEDSSQVSYMETHVV